MSKVVIVVPCYNEFDRLPLDALKDYSSQGNGHHFLFIDDGSTDATGELLEDLNAFDGNTFTAIRLRQNCGKGEAVRQGFLTALNEHPDYIGYWDADFATPLNAIPEFCRTLDQSPDIEIVMGARVILLGHDIERRLIRHYLGRAFATAASLALGVRVYDTMCGAKLFRVTSRTAALFAKPFTCRWIFDAEWMARYLSDGVAKTCRAKRGTICELPLRQWREVPGSKLRFRDFVRAAFDLASIFLRYRCGKLGEVPTENSVIGARRSAMEGTEGVSKGTEPRNAGFHSVDGNSDGLGTLSR